MFYSMINGVIRLLNMQCFIKPTSSGELTFIKTRTGEVLSFIGLETSQLKNMTGGRSHHISSVSSQ